MSKKVPMAIALLAVGILVLPGTVSLFAGQHYWYNLTGGKDVGGQIPCEKCHADIAEEMMSPLITIHSGETGYGRMECEYCHRTFNLDDNAQPSDNQLPINSTYYSGYYYTYATVKNTHDQVQPGKEAHAAATVPCMYCHSGSGSGWFHPPTFGDKYCSCHGTSDGGLDYYYHGDRFYTGTSNDDPGECIKCHGTGDGSTHGPIYIPPAGGFGLTINSSDTGSLAAHRAFVERAIASDLMEDANEACIACHTRAPVRINWSHRVSLEFNVTPEFDLSVKPTHFNITQWWVNGTTDITVWGNTTGSGFTNTSAPGFSWPGKNPANYTNGYT